MSRLVDRKQSRGWPHIFQAATFLDALVYLIPPPHSLGQLLWNSLYSAVLSPQCDALYIASLFTLPLF